MVYLSFYLSKTLLLNASWLAIIPLVMYVFGFFATLGCDKTNEVMGRRRSYALGCVVTCMGAVLCYLTGGTDGVLPDIVMWGLPPGAFYVMIVAVIFGCGTSLVMVTGVSFVNDLVGENLSTSAFVYGCMSLTDKLSSGLFIILIQNQRNTICLGSGDSTDDDNLDQCGNFVRDVMVFVPIGCCILGCAVLPFAIGHPSKEEESGKKTRRVSFGGHE